MDSSRIEDRTLLCAQGYFELGMVAEALEELDSLPPLRQQRSEVLQMRLLIHIRARRWQEALALSETLYHLRPDEALGFIHAAFCLHELGRTAEAKALLLNGPRALLSEPTYHYNLGCYDAALGNLEEAQAHLRVSFKLDKKFRELARTDPDLKGVWSVL
jgi:tetratricopeptide (TPR) repeat protein